MLEEEEEEEEMEEVPPGGGGGRRVRFTVFAEVKDLKIFASSWHYSYFNTVC